MGVTVVTKLNATQKSGGLSWTSGQWNTVIFDYPFKDTNYVIDSLGCIDRSADGNSFEIQNKSTTGFQVKPQVTTSTGYYSATGSTDGFVDSGVLDAAQVVQTATVNVVPGVNTITFPEAFNTTPTVLINGNNGLMATYVSSSAGLTTFQVNASDYGTCTYIAKGT